RKSVHGAKTNFGLKKNKHALLSSQKTTAHPVQARTTHKERIPKALPQRRSFRLAVLLNLPAFRSPAKSAFAAMGIR
ncbi:hypothetical protein ACFO4E_12365, partial [Nocardiopsis mangrovi]